MFTLHRKNKLAPIYIFQGDPPIAFGNVANLDSLAELHTAIGEFLTANRIGEFIGSAAAQQIAKDAGYDIPITTLVNSCTRGTIAGAQKRSGRWFMPKASFDQWFGEWRVKYEERARNQVKETA